MKSILSLSLLALAASSGAFGRTYFVSAGDLHSPGDGSESRPFTTIQRAIDLARAGDTVLVGPGFYRESLVLSQSGTASAPIVFRSAPFGAAVVDGSEPVTNFEPAPAEIAAASVWFCRSYQPLYCQLPAATITRWTKQGPVGIDQIERCSREDALWLDGRHIDEARTKDELRPNSYWLDRKNGGIYVALDRGENISAHVVEGSRRLSLLRAQPNTSFVQVQGFRFTRAAATFQGTAVEIGTRTPVAGKTQSTGRGWIFSDNIVSWGGWSGVQIHGYDHQILRNVIEYNGNQGIGGSGCFNLLLDGNISRLNNWKKIRTGFEGGGGKFVLSEHVTIRNHEAAYNIGPGIWFDIDNHSVRIEHCSVHDNTDGIFIEISHGPTLLTGNVCYANGQGGGIIIGESSNVVIDHNVLALNGAGISLRNLQGRHGNGATSGRDANDPLQYQLSHIAILNNFLVENSMAGIVNTDFPIDVAQDQISSDRNTFYKNPPEWWKTPDKQAVALSDDGAYTPPESHGYRIFNTVEAARRELGLEEHSRIKDPGFTLAFIHEFPWPDQIKPLP